jgi:hypothetical protein
MGINWVQDVDSALAAARARRRPVFLDFSAAPM